MKKNYGYRQKQLQIQETAHEMELALDTFHNMLEPLEEYIGKAGYYPNWDNRRQLYRKTIKDSNDTAEGFEDLFLTQLFIVKASLNKKPEFFRKEVQKDYYKWISAVGIDVNNCPEKLKHFLYEINEILEGRGERFVEQTKELVKDVKLTPQDALGFFSSLQEPLNKNRSRGKSLGNKNWNELGNENRISGDGEQGEQTFGQIAGSVANRHDNFDFYSQKGQQEDGMDIDDEIQKGRQAMINSIKQNINKWKIEEVITFNGCRYDWKKQKWVRFGDEKRETMLISQSIEEKDLKYYDYGALEINPEKMFNKSRFSEEEWTEIEQNVNNSRSSEQTGRININGEEYEPTTEIRLDPTSVDAVRQGLDNNNPGTWVQVGMVGSGFIALITGVGERVYRIFRG